MSRSYVGTQGTGPDPCVISLPAVHLRARLHDRRVALEDGGGNIIASVLLPAGGVGGMLVGRIQPDGSQSLGVIVSQEIPGTTPYNIENPVSGPGARFSWRLLPGE